MDKDRFAAARQKIIGRERERRGIGTQGEKTVHAVLKHYYAPDEDMHEIPIDVYIADIFTGRGIIEIQTAALLQLRDKLACFLPQYPVTVVYPIARVKWLSWIDPDSGACSPLRKSPKTGSIYQIFAELYWLKPFLDHENIRFAFPLLDIEEYRLLDGYSRDKKRGSHRHDRIPVALADEVSIDCREDYLSFIPYELPEPFTTRELAQMVKINDRLAARTLNVLRHLGIVERSGKKGRAYLYRVVS